MLTKNIKVTQLKAAREWLGWSVTDLAEKMGVHHQTVYNIEKDHIVSKASMDKAWTAFYRAGLLITEKSIEEIGNLREYKGESGFSEFKKDVLLTVKYGGEVFVSDVDERLFDKWGGIEALSYREQMKGISDLDFRILIGKGDTNTLAAEYACYRQDTSKDFRPDLPTYNYGNKTAFIVFHPDDVDVVVINNQTLAEANREKFLRRWEAALPLK